MDRKMWLIAIGIMLCVFAITVLDWLATRGIGFFGVVSYAIIPESIAVLMATYLYYLWLGKLAAIALFVVLVSIGVVELWYLHTYGTPQWMLHLYGV